MTFPVDTISRRKLVLVRQLYRQAEQQAETRHSVPNRIMSVIGFDLSVETLLKVIISTLDQQKSPADSFPGLLDQCDNLLSKNNLQALPYRSHVLHVHSIRNDAQHKAKYPNETDVSDCRTYTRDFCKDVIGNIWGVSFDVLSPIEWIDDPILRQMLEVSLSDIQAQNLKKGLTLAGITFDWASSSISKLLPRGVDGLYESQVPELGRETVKYVNSVLKHIENTAKHYAAMMTTGISVVDYNRLRSASPSIEFSYSSTIQEPDKVDLKIRVYWQDKNPDYQTALWVHDFVVNSIVYWQVLGLSPGIPHTDQLQQAQKLIQWSTDDVLLL
jgi:hypothetical protein